MSTDVQVPNGYPNRNIHLVDGISGMNPNGNSETASCKSLLHRFHDEEVHDLVCVGFGPASLAIAVALHDALESSDPSLQTPDPKVRFLEKQSSFAWHAGMLLPGAKMQISFVKDLATLRNPRSQFTFLNYLHQKGRLVQFTNLGTFLPQRIEYEDYMKWCAVSFGDVVDYGRQVESVTAGKAGPQSGVVEYFNVASKDLHTGRIVTTRAKNVVIAAGGRPNFPKCFPSNHPRIIHSSEYATTLANLFPSDPRPQSFAVIGAGQSAAEVFCDIPSRFPGAKSYLLIRGDALRPSDDSPFVNEIFNPERVDDVFSQGPNVREQAFALDKDTNYGVVRLELLERIYSTLYSYRIQHVNEDQWPQRILNHREVLDVGDVEVDRNPAIQLTIQNNCGDFYKNTKSATEILNVDAVIVASGYTRDVHEDMLKGLRHLMPGGYKAGKNWHVRRNYSVEFLDGVVKHDAGVWLQGCNESSHGLSDTLLSILAVRGGEMVQSIFGNAQPCHNGHVRTLVNGR